MIHFFLQRGHSLKELINLSAAERLVMMISMEIETDMQKRLMEGADKS